MANIHGHYLQAGSSTEILVSEIRWLAVSDMFRHGHEKCNWCLTWKPGNSSEMLGVRLLWLVTLSYRNERIDKPMFFPSTSTLSLLPSKRMCTSSILWGMSASAVRKYLQAYKCPRDVTSQQFQLPEEMKVERVCAWPVEIWLHESYRN
jgi:hypothetical protein